MLRLGWTPLRYTNRFFSLVYGSSACATVLFFDLGKRQYSRYPPVGTDENIVTEFPNVYYRQIYPYELQAKLLTAVV